MFAASFFCVLKLYLPIPSLTGTMVERQRVLIRKADCWTEED